MLMSKDVTRKEVQLKKPHTHKGVSYSITEVTEQKILISITEAQAKVLRERGVI